MLSVLAFISKELLADSQAELWTSSENQLRTMRLLHRKQELIEASELLEAPKKLAAK